MDVVEEACYIRWWEGGSVGQIRRCEALLWRCMKAIEGFRSRASCIAVGGWSKDGVAAPRH